jgi:hypothetical protein
MASSWLASVLNLDILASERIKSRPLHSLRGLNGNLQGERLRETEKR